MKLLSKRMKFPKEKISLNTCTLSFKEKTRDKCFKLKTPNRKYHIRSTDINKAEFNKWIDTISSCIDKTKNTGSNNAVIDKIPVKKNQFELKSGSFNEGVKKPLPPVPPPPRSNSQPIPTKSTSLQQVSSTSPQSQQQYSKPPVFLPYGWEERKNKEGKTYYQNNNNGTTQWDPPSITPMSPPNYSQGINYPTPQSSGMSPMPQNHFQMAQGLSHSGNVMFQTPINQSPQFPMYSTSAPIIIHSPTPVQYSPQIIQFTSINQQSPTQGKKK